MLISFKDWIAGKHHLKGRLKRIQEDVLSDDQFPDTTDENDMISYLKKQNASRSILVIFCKTYGKYKREILDHYDFSESEVNTNGQYEKSL